MCGIAGVVAEPGAVPVQQGTLSALTRALHHRGPDAHGVWSSDDQRIALVHTRLSIIDLSETGAQPMRSACGRYFMTFNGEIYNYAELRSELQSRGHTFRGSSDSEVLLELFAREGVQCLSRLDGMFAFAIYDANDHRLFCARDPLGEKPFYFSASAARFCFASEVQALERARLVDPRPDIAAIKLLFRQGSIPAPYTHLESVRLLEPGCFLELDTKTLTFHQRRYWTLDVSPEADAISDRRQAIELVGTELRRSVARRARADVPIGAFLSGGLDSSVVCALLVEQGIRDVRTFTVTMPGQPGDEAEFAGEVARRLGLEHQQVPLELDQKGDWLEAALDAMDVPSNDGPNTWLVSRAISQAGLKVACSGLGGDELFHGYPSFSQVPRLQRLSGPIGSFGLMRKTARGLAYLRPHRFLARGLDALAEGATLQAWWLAKRSLFSEREANQLFNESMREQAEATNATARLDALSMPRNIAPTRQIAHLELNAYMRDQLLRDTDCMSMAHSLEVRVPLIAPSVVEAVAKLGASVFLGEHPKSLLMDIIEPLLPRSLFTRPKQGFILNWPAILARRDRCPTGPRPLSGSAVGREWRRFITSRSGASRIVALEAMSRSIQRTARQARATDWR